MARTRPFLAAALAGALLAPSASAQRGRRDTEVVAGYRRALADLAGGSTELAVARLMRLEEAASPGCVLAVERHTAELLAEIEPEAILGQGFLRLAVHQERYLKQRESARLYGFERDSVNGLRDLGELYLDSSSAAEARSLGAGLLTYLAAVLGATRSTSRLDAGRLLLEEALERDPDDLAALHSLAFNLELRGRPKQALVPLERLVELAPEDARYRLRRAVVTVKSGRFERGRRLLEEAAREGPVWTRDLATQELARLLAAAGRAEEAEAVLRRALDELPAEKLSLQLAALLDPRWGESGEVLFSWLARRRDEPGPTGRWLYEDGPKDEVDALRRELGAAVSARAAGALEAIGRLPLPGVDWRVRGAC